MTRSTGRLARRRMLQGSGAALLALGLSGRPSHPGLSGASETSSSRRRRTASWPSGPTRARRLRSRVARTSFLSPTRIPLPP